ncbi:hypothetical protein BH20ACT23_BH20ACT23_19720 [soil metagenome]
MNRAQAQAWIDAYGEAWRAKDASGAAALFTEDGVYKSHPFREADVSREGISNYWMRATHDQRDLELHFGDPVVEGDHVAVEWWAAMTDDTGDVTLPGALILRFSDDGFCEELREYWHIEAGRHRPFEGWGR